MKNVNLRTKLKIRPKYRHQLYSLTVMANYIVTHSRGEWSPDLITSNRTRL